MVVQPLGRKSVALSDGRYGRTKFLVQSTDAIDISRRFAQSMPRQESSSDKDHDVSWA